MSQSVSPLNGVVAFVRSLPGELYLRREVARALGMTPAAVRAVSYSADHPDHGPSYAVNWGSKQIHLYTSENLTALRDHFTRQQTKGDTGRPRVWSLEEGEQRARRGDLARYHRRAAIKYTSAGELDKARASLDRAEAITAELEQQHRQRMADLATRGRSEMSQRESIENMAG